MSPSDAASSLAAKFPSAITSEKEFRGETTLGLAATAIREVCQFARESLGFDYLVDISGVDHFGDDPRFEIVYELYSMAHGTHLRLKIPVGEDPCEAPSVTGIWPGANWHEREIYDMMGIRFTGHPDLRRILMWEGYPYHPLRKDFPLEGKPSDTPGLAFSEVAPLAGGPFVTVPTDGTTQVREPRAHHAGEPPRPEKFPEGP
ncbi:MAG: NADH-quinone oxidoreductase subunit C [Terrimicrobiaceae bacterium]